MDNECILCGIVGHMESNCPHHSVDGLRARLAESEARYDQLAKDSAELLEKRLAESEARAERAETALQEEQEALREMCAFIRLLTENHLRYSTMDPERYAFVFGLDDKARDHLKRLEEEK